jgi:hypothetical protein
MCVYCGRPFCERHGVVGQDGEEVCDSKNCVAKREDLAAHLVYREVAREFNSARVCGLEECEQEFEGQCSRCKAYFCRLHIELREMLTTEEGVRTERLVLVCRHCFVRRTIWERT